MLRAILRLTLPVWVLLAAIAVGGGPVVAGGPLAQVEQELQRIAELDRAAQQQVLRRLEERLGAAADRVLPDRQAKPLKAELRQTLRRKMLSWDDLRSLLGQLDRLETAAVEQLSRQYRIQTYRAFAADRSAYERRQRAWRDVERAWRSSDSPLWQRDRLIAWLGTAVERSRPGHIAALPPAPVFGEPTQARPAPSTVTQAAPPASDAVPSAPSASSADPESSEPLREPTPEPGPAEPAPPRPPRPAPARPAEPGSEPSSEPGTPSMRKVSPPPSAIVRPEADTATDAPPIPETTPDPLPSPIRESVPEVAVEPQPNAPRRTQPLDLPPLPEPAVAVVVRADSESPDADSPLMERAAPAEPHRAAPPPSGGSYSWLPQLLPPMPDGRAGHPEDTVPALPLLHSDARREFAGPPRRVELGRLIGSELEDLPERAPPVISALAYVDPPPLAVPPTEPTVDVNREELRARIAGTNLALRALEAEIDRKSAWPIGELATFTARLERLAARADDLRLFLDLLEPTERRLFESPRSPLPVAAQLRGQIAAARRRVALDDMSRDAIVHREMLDQLLAELRSIERDR